jgi:hypothetical protein
LSSAGISFWILAAAREARTACAARLIARQLVRQQSVRGCLWGACAAPDEQASLVGRERPFFRSGNW